MLNPALPGTTRRISVRPTAYSHEMSKPIATVALPCREKSRIERLYRYVFLGRCMLRLHLLRFGLTRWNHCSLGAYDHSIWSVLRFVKTVERINLAEPLGFEPRLEGPKSSVLPLDDSSIVGEPPGIRTLNYEFKRLVLYR